MFAIRKGWFGLIGIALLLLLIGWAGFALSGDSAARANHSAGSRGSQSHAKEQPVAKLNVPSAEEIAKLPPDGGEEFNRLIFESSPYLLQHARNPVDWHAWNPETLKLAKELDKPIFLSVGYSTCHWCHVMEHESFEKPDVAAVINEHYIPVKVDREELPEVDATYMAATQMLTGRGGWPNNVWLTPDGHPFFAATYLPRSQFKQLLLQFSNAFKERRDRIDEVAAELMAVIEESQAVQAAIDGYEPSAEGLQRALKQALSMADPTYGGLGSAPKFPPHSTLAALSYELKQRPDQPQLRKFYLQTLDRMAAGGIYDHVGGGFHRYSTDARWLLPHFEKMLYDNAQLARAYTDAYLLTGEPRYRRVAVETLDWTLREMQSPEGGFYSAIDADSEGEEGKFYVWTLEELEQALGGDAAAFAKAYGAAAEGNYFDEATQTRTGANVLHLTDPATDSSQFSAARSKLLAAREKRERPHMDDKVLVNWNGLLIGALAYAGDKLSEPRFIEAARRAADFILNELHTADGLMHSWRNGKSSVAANLDDYACLIHGLLELHRANPDPELLANAESLAAEMQQHFGDPAKPGALYTSSDRGNANVPRRKDSADDVTPSGNGMAARVLAELARATGDASYAQAARAILTELSGAMQQSPMQTENLQLAAALLAEQPISEAGGDAVSRIGPVTAKVELEQREATPGEELRGKLILTVSDGYHVNAPRELLTSSIEDVIPLALSLSDSAWAHLRDPQYPPVEEFRFAGQAATVQGYDGTVEIPFSISVEASAPAGKQSIALKLQAQPCDDKSCQLPEVHELQLPLMIR